MPTIVSHAVFATALGSVYAVEPMPTRFWTLTAVCAMLPDVDVISFAFGIPYGSLWGHRGITHSLLFAALTGLMAAAVAFRRNDTEKPWASLAVFLAVATATHPLLDSLTNGGLGVALLAPVSDTRYFAPWRPIEVSPIGVGFFSWQGARVLFSEAVWVGLPSLALALVGWSRRRAAARRGAG